MADKKYKAKDKVIQQITKKGLIQKNLITGEEENISQKEADFSFSSQEQERDYQVGGARRKQPQREKRVDSPLRYKKFETEDAIGSSKLKFSQAEQEFESEQQSDPIDEAGQDGELRESPSYATDGNQQGESFNKQNGTAEPFAEVENADDLPNEIIDRLPKGYGQQKPFLINTWRQSITGRAGNWTAQKITRGGRRWVHKKISEVEDDNLGLKAVHKEERTGESLFNAVTLVRRHRQKGFLRKAKKSAIQVSKKYVKLEKAKRRIERAANKPSVSRLQKKVLQQQYAKAFRDHKKAEEVAAKASETAIKRTTSLLNLIAPRMMKFFAAVVSWIFVIFDLIIVLILVIALIFFALAFFFNDTIIATSYLAEDIDIHDASLEVTRLEAELDKKIKDIPSQPEWSYIDEFRYSLDPIGHNPFVLMGWLTVKYDDFKYPDIKGYLQELHNARYDLQLDVETEEREDEDGDPYTWYILNVTLHSKSIEEIIEPEMELDTTGDLRDRMEVLMESKGNHQIISNPFDYDWTSSYSSLYGYRVDPIEGKDLQIHRGLDLPAPKGTPIRAGVTGSVIETGYNDTFGNYMLIKDEKYDIVVKYAHCDRLLLATGQPVRAGETIVALVGNTGGSTGDHLHIEVKENGQYLNPIYATDWGIPNEGGT